jgi:hypothetical protein
MDGIEPWFEFPSHGARPETEPRLHLGVAVLIIAALSVSIWVGIIFAIIKGLIQ